MNTGKLFYDRMKNSWLAAMQRIRMVASGGGTPLFLGNLIHCCVFCLRTIPDLAAPRFSDRTFVNPSLCLALDIQPDPHMDSTGGFRFSSASGNPDEAIFSGRIDLQHSHPSDSPGHFHPAGLSGLSRGLEKPWVLFCLLYLFCRHPSGKHLRRMVANAVNRFASRASSASGDRNPLSFQRRGRLCFFASAGNPRVRHAHRPCAFSLCHLPKGSRLSLSLAVDAENGNKNVSPLSFAGRPVYGHAAAQNPCQETDMADPAPSQLVLAKSIFLFVLAHLFSEKRAVFHSDPPAHLGHDLDRDLSKPMGERGRLCRLCLDVHQAIAAIGRSETIPGHSPVISPLSRSMGKRVDVHRMGKPGNPNLMDCVIRLGG